MEGIEDGGPGWGWRDAHSCTRDLLPIHVVKLYKVILEHNLESCNKFFGIEMVESNIFVGAKVSGNGCSISWDAGIHGVVQIFLRRFEGMGIIGMR